jgi:hypothetical protein
VVTKVVGDSTGWNRSAAKYDAAFRRLMKALEPERDAEGPLAARAKG